MRQCIACGRLFEPDFSIVCKGCEPLWSYPSYARLLTESAESLEIKECPICGNEFWWSSDKRRARKYCSCSCASIAKKRQDKARAKGYGKRRKETV